MNEAGQPDLRAYVRSLRAEPPKTLHHFTSIEGLLGIITEQKLRLTRAVCSNDAQEVRHIVDHARAAADVIRDMDMESKGLPNAARAVLERLWERLKEDHAGWHGDMSLSHTVVSDMCLPDPYVACFCAEAYPGILHWGHYGRAGEGFSLEIDTTLLTEEWRRRFVPVRYDFAEQIWNVTKILEAFLLNEKGDVGPKPEGSFERDRAMIVADKMEEVIRAVSVGMKHSEFEPEHEWRVSWLREVDGEMDIFLRASGLELISYIEMPLPHEAIRKIVIGTKRDLRRTAGSLAAYLHSRGRYVEIEASGVPSR